MKFPIRLTILLFMTGIYIGYSLVEGGIGDCGDPFAGTKLARRQR